jgi:hypothetical protein
MKWDDLYLLKLSPDKVINESASTYRKYYTLPRNRRFVPPGESTKADQDWTTLGPDSLRNVKLTDKLMIVAHGSTTEAGDRRFNALADDLASWGLTEVGLITFKCCYLGRGDFLENFVRYAEMVSRIRIGWVKGYRGPAQTWYGGPVKPSEQVLHHNGWGFKGGNDRYKIVPGYAGLSRPGTRYVLPAEDD